MTGGAGGAVAGREELMALVEPGAKVHGGGLARSVLRHLLTHLDEWMEVTGSPGRLSCHLPATGTPEE